MSPETIVVALDANVANEAADDFRALPVSAKLSALEKHIIEICEQLKISAPDSLWVVAWCETAIETDIGELALSPEGRKNFKTTFQGLTQRYPNLAIVAGTVQTYKNTSDLNKVDQVVKDYQLLKDLELEEESVPPTFIKDEREKVITARNNNTDFTLLRNSCLVFYRKTIWCHDKAAPVEEAKNNQHLTNPLFRPPKQKTLSPVCKLLHPTTRQEINIGIEICNEHWFSYLKKSDSNNEIYLHFIISGTISLRHSYLVGKYNIHLDSRIKPVLILGQKEDIEYLPIQYYQSNFFKENDPLTGPLQPVFPLVKNILFKLDTAIKKLLPGEIRSGLQALRDSISAELYTNIVEDNPGAFAFLESKLNEHKDLFVNKHAINRLFPYPDLRKLYKELNELVEEDKKENPFFSDIHRRDDARLL